MRLSCGFDPARRRATGMGRKGQPGLVGRARSARPRAHATGTYLIRVCWWRELAWYES